jgi:hypothetical protein
VRERAVHEVEALVVHELRLASAKPAGVSKAKVMDISNVEQQISFLRQNFPRTFGRMHRSTRKLSLERDANTVFLFTFGYFIRETERDLIVLRRKHERCHALRFPRTEPPVPLNKVSHKLTGLRFVKRSCHFIYTRHWDFLLR